MSKLGSIIGRSVQDKQGIKDQLGNRDTIIPIFKNPSENVDVYETFFENDMLINSDFTLDHPTNGTLDDSTLSLDRTTASTGSKYYITNKDNVFYENFDIDTFNDSSVTDADWNTTSSFLEIEQGEQAQTSSVFLHPSKQIKTVTISASTDVNASSLNLSVAADGSTFESASFDTKHTFSTQGSDLRINIENPASVTFPLSFPIEFASGGVAVKFTELWADYTTT